MRSLLQGEVDTAPAQEFAVLLPLPAEPRLVRLPDEGVVIAAGLGPLSFPSLGRMLRYHRSRIPSQCRMQAPMGMFFGWL